MEWRETSPTSSVIPGLPAAARALDITPEALQTSDRIEEADVWLMEEGDDSVFYSDEDQTDQDRNPHTSCDFGATKTRCPLKGRILQGKGIPGPGTEAILDKGNVGMQNEASLQFDLAKSETSESLQPKSRNPDVQKQPKLNITTDTGKSCSASLMNWETGCLYNAKHTATSYFQHIYWLRWKRKKSTSNKCLAMNSGHQATGAFIKTGRLCRTATPKLLRSVFMTTVQAALPCPWWRRLARTPDSTSPSTTSRPPNTAQCPTAGSAGATPGKKSKSSSTWW